MPVTVVARMPFEMLASIFEICAGADWRAPLRLAGVCQFWRQTIHLTPQAWRFIDADGSYECCDLYLDRSGSSTLHLYLPDPYNLEDIGDIAHRIQCLTTPYLLEYMAEYTFPALTTLRYVHTDYMDDWPVLDQITNQRFPNLRHLEIHWMASKCDDFPPLESLHILICGTMDTWPINWGLLAACSASLVSLQITQWDPIDNRGEFSSIDFPRLRNLKVVKMWKEEVESPLFKFSTPNLRVYIEDDDGDIPEQPLHEDLASVTHMRLKRLYTPNNLALMLNVRMLQLELEFSNFCDALGELRENSSIFPRLEQLEFCSNLMEKDESENARRMLGEIPWKGRPNMRTPTINDHWIREFSPDRFTEYNVRPAEWKHLYC